MTMPALPNMADVDPTDPDGFVRAFLARYFTPGLVDSYIRTFVPVTLGSAWSWAVLNYSWLGLPEKPSATLSLTVTGAAIAAYYFAARLLERRYPTLGRWLVALNLTKARPVYVAVDAAPAVEAAAAVDASTRRPL